MDAVRLPAEGPRSLSRLLQLFEVLAAAPDGLTLADLNAALDTPKSSLLNLLRPLVSDGYLVHASGSYRLGLRAFQMATGILAAWDMARVYRPFLERIARETGETAMLAVADATAGTLSYVDVVLSDQPIRYQIAVGTTRPLHAAAAGRVLLAFGEPAGTAAYLRRTRLDGGMDRPFSRKSLEEELETIRREGIEVSVDRLIAGLSSIAAPVFDASGRCIAALALGGPSERIAPRRGDLVETVRALAQEASASPQ